MRAAVAILRERGVGKEDENLCVLGLGVLLSDLAAATMTRNR